MSQRALSFGAVAAAYERFRPGYPDELVGQVLAYAGRPVGTALEIGAGTGKATRVLAWNGVAVTATDPDPAMLLELRRTYPTPSRRCGRPSKTFHLPRPTTWSSRRRHCTGPNQRVAG